MDLVRQTLSDLIERHGTGLVNEPRRCEGLLRDYCGTHRREIFVLVTALEEGVGADLLGSRGRAPTTLLLGQLADRLHDNRALDEAAARWAVESWAVALGVISGPETVEDQAPAPPTASHVRVAPLPTPTPPRDLVVSAGGEGDFLSIGEALGNATEGTRILVRPGVYDEGIVLDRRVEIAGDGPAGQVVVRSVRSSCIRMDTDEAIVDVPGGRLMLEDCDVSSDSLACIGIHGSTARPVVRRCVIRDGADAGIFAFDGGGGTVEECEIRGNRNIGVAISGGANPLLRRCKIHDGGNAGVVSWDGGRGIVEKCEIFGNAHAGVGVSEGGDPVARGCSIHGGKDVGVFVHDGGRGEFSHCDIFGHEDAEVAVSRGGNPLVRSCRMHDGAVGIAVTDEGNGTFEQCDVFGNRSAGVVIRLRSRPVLRRCTIRENGGSGVTARDEAAGTLEGCRLRANALGPWDVDETSRLRAPGTIEE
jgi:parallel beta-helix repeat protein